MQVLEIGCFEEWVLIRRRQELEASERILPYENYIPGQTSATGAHLKSRLRLVLLLQTFVIERRRKEADHNISSLNP